MVQTVLGARAAFENDFLSFLSYDDEHHRVAIIDADELGARPDGVASLHHTAFTYKILREPLENNSKLKDLSDLPFFTVDQGPTTSLYYEDLNRNQLEFHVENYKTLEAFSKRFFSQAFAENPVGVEFNHDRMLQKLCSGVPEDELKVRPSNGARDGSYINLCYASQ